MKKIICIFCDITGTIIGYIKNSSEDCEIYHELLSILAENDNWEELLVSIIPRENNDLTEVNKMLSLK